MQEVISARLAPRRLRRTGRTRSWGDVNLTLNRLVREGLLTGFKTNLSSPDRDGLKVAITPASGGGAEEARRRVEDDLSALVGEVMVTIAEHEPA